MNYKFETLEVWQRSLEYADQIHEIADRLPKHEHYNLADQMTRAANSIALNVAEGSTGQTDAEQDRFLRIALRDRNSISKSLYTARHFEHGIPPTGGMPSREIFPSKPHASGRLLGAGDLRSPCSERPAMGF